ncbi:restriction endonuclease R.XbaI [Geminocystis sp. NIES-3708]|uniref:ApaLI family restriction endonuclease n=1 Tax=Geminocystis sp. NIES-3708 TaxID=1615909 RepID=UPI0005FCD209|nr:ApaLI family restriction endonuclease [Geminocystis sp. NIES-3708]BAQ61035.1 restriction endonuclease R.XbaI [Geminocystis sp. NIES-3708]
MKNDDTSHYLIYRVLGITSQEGQKIDEYQNIGRFLYNYAGSFLKEIASLCLLFNNPQGKKTTVKNSFGTKPKTFEIDFLDGNDAIEIKWRDATTDRDHNHERAYSCKSYTK